MEDYPEFVKTKFLSKQTKEDHLKLLEGYTKNCDALVDALVDADKNKANANSGDYREIIAALRHNYNAKLLHHMYFSQISSSKTKVPDLFKKLISQVNEECPVFNNYDKWKKHFVATAKASRGWAIFGLDPFAAGFVNVAVDSHDIGLPPAFVPLLVLDVWEHAYIEDFGTDRAAYIDEWFEYIDWDQIVRDTQMMSTLIKANDVVARLTASTYKKLDILGCLGE